MIALNPLKRAQYLLWTTLSEEDCRRRVLDTMDRYNRGAKNRSIMATAFGERFTARIERNSLGYANHGNALKDFMVDAVGIYRATGDGAVEVTIGFHRPTSIFQVVWRLMVLGAIAASVWTLVDGPFIPFLGVAVGVGILPLFLLWSLVAFVQGMGQAGRDWSILLDFMQTALGSHTIDRI